MVSIVKFTKIKETCLYVHDLELAKKFYHEMLELPVISYVPDKHIFFRAGESVLLCFNPEDSIKKTSPPPHHGGGKQHFAFEVSASEYENAKRWIEERGVSITEKVVWQSGAESFYFEDLEGNVLEIVPAKGVWD